MKIGIQELLLACITMLIAPATSCTTTCTIMEFNIEHGGTLISLTHILDVIHAAHPDIVCLEEAEGTIPQIAAKLGWPYYDTRLHLLSRFPIIDPPEGKGIYAFVEISPGKVIAVSNVHLPDDQYGPHLLQEGKSIATILETEKRVRLAKLSRHIPVLSALAAQGYPTFLTGDFNAPSHLDWTPETAKKLSPLHSAFPWPVSSALAAAGLRDTYREAHPNPLTHPGYTWWAHRPATPGWNPQKNDLHDRIDFIYAAGPAKVVSSKDMGSCCTSCQPSSWSSDHCAIVTTCEVIPAAHPVLVAIHKRLLQRGETLFVTYHTPEEPGHSILILPLAGKTAAPALKKKLGTSAHGTIRISTSSWKPQAYEAQLVNSAGSIISRIPFIVKAPRERTTLSLNKTSFAYNEPITASWRLGPGNRWDWLNIRKRTAKPDAFRMWASTSAAFNGSVTFDAATQPSWPLEPGLYTISFCIDDSTKEIAHIDFTVEQPRKQGERLCSPCNFDIVTSI